MNQGIYTSVPGMVALEKWMDITANNLANVSTTGFKRDGVFFSDEMEKQMRAAGGLGPVIGTLSTSVSSGDQYTVLDLGPMQPTGQPLDFAIDGPEGMFAVKSQDGSIRYTRDGAFKLNSDSELVNSQGLQVLDDRGNPITIPTGKISSDTSGIISVDGKAVATIGVYNGTFTKEGNNLWTSDNAKPVDEVAEIKPQTLEGSNVNAVLSMIEMIQIGRSYELSQKAIQQQDDLSQKLIQSLSAH